MSSPPASPKQKTNSLLRQGSHLRSQSFGGQVGGQATTLRLYDFTTLNHMIHIGQPAPDFTNITAYHKGEFHTVNLSDYKGKWLVFFFYPRDFTFICPTEIRGFAKMCGDFGEKNCNILACSTDSEWSHKNWFERDLPEVDYPILADVTHVVSKAYDVYNESNGESERGLFIIDPEGNVRYALMSASSVGRSVGETMRVLKALQTGELCPLEWNEGGTTLGNA